MALLPLAASCGSSELRRRGAADLAACWFGALAGPVWFQADGSAPHGRNERRKHAVDAVCLELCLGRCHALDSALVFVDIDRQVAPVRSGSLGFGRQQGLAR